LVGLDLGDPYLLASLLVGRQLAVGHRNDLRPGHGGLIARRPIGRDQFAGAKVVADRDHVVRLALEGPVLVEDQIGHLATG
jgi:hypothetical protein